MRKVDFLAKDGIELSGLLYETQEKTDSVIISVHGMTSDCFRKRDEFIAKKANNNSIDYFCFNNRGSELVRYLRRNDYGKRKKYLGGMSFENIYECHNDVEGAIETMMNLGYNNIYLQGHSLGSTKVVYTYNKILEENKLDMLMSIKGVILLSLVDIPSVLKFFLKDNSDKYIKIAEEKISNGEEMNFMPKESFIHPISPKTFLQYAKDYEKIDFINTITDENLEVLNNISVPIFMRWGNVQELILQDAEQYSGKIRKIIKNENADIDYINGADHGYHGYEKLLADQIVGFINNKCR